MFTDFVDLPLQQYLQHQFQNSKLFHILNDTYQEWQS